MSRSTLSTSAAANAVTSCDLVDGRSLMHRPWPGPVPPVGCLLPLSLMEPLPAVLDVLWRRGDGTARLARPLIVAAREHGSRTALTIRRGHGRRSVLASSI